MKKSTLALAVISICGNASALEVTWQTDPLSLVNADNVKLNQYNEVEITYDPYSGGYVGDELPKYYRSNYSQENYTISAMECTASASLKEISIDMSLEYTRDQWVSNNQTSAHSLESYERDKSNLISQIDNYISFINNLDIESYKLNLQRQIEGLEIDRISSQDSIDHYIENRDEKYDDFRQNRLDDVEMAQGDLDRYLERKAEYESRDEGVPGNILRSILDYTRYLNNAQKALDEYTLDFHINDMNESIQRREEDKNNINIKIEENELKLANAESYIADKIKEYRDEIVPLEARLATYGGNVDDYIDNYYYKYLN